MLLIAIEYMGPEEEDRLVKQELGLEVFYRRMQSHMSRESMPAVELVEPSRDRFTADVQTSNGTKDCNNM